MKRVDLIRHLERHGCELLPEGGEHSVYVNRAVKRSFSVPRHREVNDFLAQDLRRPRYSAARTLKDLQKTRAMALGVLRRTAEAPHK